MKQILKNKKGNYQDIPEYVYIVVSLFFIILISYSILSNFNTNVQANTLIPNETKTISQDYTVGFTNVDYVIPILYLLFLSFSALAARFIPSSSKFMIVSVVFIVIMPFVGMFADNITNGSLENGYLATQSLSFPLSTYFATHLALFASIYSFVIAFALLTKGEKPQ